MRGSCESLSHQSMRMSSITAPPTSSRLSNDGTATRLLRYGVLAALLLLFTITGGTVLFQRQGRAHPSHDAIRSSSDHRKLQTGYETSKLMERFQIARAKYMEQLTKDYGAEYMDVLFKMKKSEDSDVKVSAARVVFNIGDADLSWARFKRKIMIKILKAQVEQKHQPFVWTTGGHSACAGHGNLFNESYTNIMKMHSVDIFQSIGLELTARSYGMGGTSAGMEIASCMKEVFGAEPDAIAWDYSMTTTKAPSKTMFYMYRGALLANKPTMFGFDCGSHHADILVDMQSRGLGSFRLSHTLVEDNIPNTEDKTQEQIDKMPPYIRSYKCGTSVESGEPTCSAERWTVFPGDEPCNKRHGQVSWHPGWKRHALKGNLLTLFLIEIMDDALKGVLEEGSDPKTLLDRLIADENKDFEQFAAVGLPTDKNFVPGLDEIDDIPNEVIYNNPNLCHTARLPAQIRYQGILTESDLKDPTSHDTYDKGTELSLIMESNEPNVVMPLSYNKGTREEHCQNHQLRIDFQDFFFANSEAWAKMTIPNPAEKQFYGINQLQGFIAICLASCGWHCPKETVGFESFLAGGNVSMTVNDVIVQNYTVFGAPRDSKASCLFLKHASGHKFQPNANDQFEIKAKVIGGRYLVDKRRNITAARYIRISSFVIW